MYGTNTFAWTNDIAVDTMAGLMFSKTSLKHRNPYKKYKWAEAKGQCDIHDIGGYNDWRLAYPREVYILHNRFYGARYIGSGNIVISNLWLWTNKPCGSGKHIKLRFTEASPVLDKCVSDTTTHEMGYVCVREFKINLDL